MSTLTLYDKRTALDHIKNLAFTRRAATVGEKKTINYIQRELKKQNIRTSVECFKWDSSSALLLKLGLIFISTYIVIYGIISLTPSFVWIYLPLNIVFFTLTFLGAKLVIDDSPILQFGREKESRNVIVTVNAKDLYPKRPVIIFSAHHDTISQKYPMRIKIILYILSFILFFAWFILTLILSIWSLLTLWSIAEIDGIFLLIRNISFIIGGLLLVVIILILANTYTDKSIGSIDNASGVAILLELAKLLNKNPLEKSDVIFIWCGAEEMGYMGSKQYCLKHFEELNHDYELDNSYNINIDMVGTYLGVMDKTGILKKTKINSNLNNVLETAAFHQNIAIKKETAMFGNFSDHKIFHRFAKKAGKNNFQVSAFISDKDSKYIHSKRDTPDKCSATNLNGCIDICNNAIRSLDLRVE